jgi:hypothetical protein
LLKKNDIRELVDPSLSDDYNSQQMNFVLLVASLCIQQSSIRRPSMSQACSVLTKLIVFEDNCNKIKKGLSGKC